MEDSIGAAFLLKMLLIFIAVFVIFIAVAINFARAFRIKNQIINRIEQSEGFTETAMGEIDEDLRNANYNYHDLATTRCNDKAYGRGYCVETFEVDNDDGLSRVYYKVTTFLVIDIPLIKTDIPVNISGETKMIERINS